MSDRDLGLVAAVASLQDENADASAHPLALARSVLDLARREFRVVTRRRWTYGLAVLFAVFTAGLVVFGTSQVGPNRYDAVVASLVEIGVYVVPLAALAFGYDAVVGAAEEGSLELLFALPIPRGGVVVGIFLGRLAAFSTALVVGSTAGAAALAVLAGPAALGPYAVFVLAATATGWAALAVATLVSTVAAGKVRALGATLAAWAWFVLLHDLVALALIAALSLPRSALAALVLTNPTDVFRLLVLSQLPATSGGFAAVLSTANLSTPVLAVALALWTAVPLALAAILAHRRRL